jgi:NTE family protein
MGHMSARLRARSGRLALVLAGGGLAGAVYEIGALRAIDDLLADRSVNDFDFYVGTSAGAIIASFLANGISPEAMIQAMTGANPGLGFIGREQLFRVNERELRERSLGLPAHLAFAWANYLLHWADMTLLDLLWSQTEALPSGLYDGMALEQYVRQVLSLPGRSNRFADLPHDLRIVATDLDTGERAVFGKDEHGEVPISLAVAASSAVPVLYKPVRIGEAEYVDGGMRGTASIDLAIENGATLVVCVNPMVPYNPRTASRQPEHEHVSTRGASAIASQVSRISTHSGLRYQMKQLGRTYPDVDIILIEPRPDDALMFHGNVMRYSTRLEVARHGFESVTLDLAEEYGRYKAILARHGVPLTRRLVIEELARIRESGYDPGVLRSVLEAHRGACDRGDRDDPLCQLTRALAVLELELDFRAGPPI